VFARFAHRLRSLLSLPAKPQLAYLEARIDNLEFALHRDLSELRTLIDESAFAMAQLVGTGIEKRVLAASREHAEAASSVAAAAALKAAREHAEAASSAAGVNALEAAREHAGAASSAAGVNALEAAREHTEAALAAYAVGATEQLARVRSEITRLNRSVQQDGAGTHAAPGPGLLADGPVERRGPESAGEVDDLLYLAIEDRFRGDPSLVRQRQERYLPVVVDRIDAEHPLLDLGCGRGEWLRLLADADIPARGVDSNLSCVDECVALGLDASIGDLVETLAATADGTFGAITLFHVVEHLPFGVLAEVLTECARVLAPGGVLVAETPNALNLRVAATNFWLDPTHVRPLHPQLLRLLGERAGFARMEDLFLHDLGDPIAVSLGDRQVDDWLTDLSLSLDGPGDYALLAWTPRSPSV